MWVKSWPGLITILVLLVLATGSAWLREFGAYTPAALGPAPAVPAGALDCGVERVNYGKGHDRAGRDCLWQAYLADGQAHFESFDQLLGSLTVYRVDVNSDQVVLTIDRGRALYGRKNVTSYTCAGLSRREAGDRLYFTLLGCGGDSSAPVGF